MRFCLIQRQRDLYITTTTYFYRWQWRYSCWSCSIRRSRSLLNRLISYRSTSPRSMLSLHSRHGAILILVTSLSMTVSMTIPMARSTSVTWSMSTVVFRTMRVSTATSMGVAMIMTMSTPATVMSLFTRHFRIPRWLDLMFFAFLGPIWVTIIVLILTIEAYSYNYTSIVFSIHFHPINLIALIFIENRLGLLLNIWP